MLANQYVPDAQTRPTVGFGSVADDAYTFGLEVAKVTVNGLVAELLLEVFVVVPKVITNEATPPKPLLVPTPLQAAKTSVTIRSVESVFNRTTDVVADAVVGVNPTSAIFAELNVCDVPVLILVTGCSLPLNAKYPIPKPTSATTAHTIILFFICLDDYVSYW